MKSLDLGSPKVAATVMKLAFPAMLAQFVNVLYSIVDRMFVGNIPAIGDTALAGLGVCAPMATFISAFAFLIGIGGAPLFAMSLGEGDGEKAKKILSNALLALVLVAVSVSAVIFAAMDPILRVFGASDKTFPYAKQYLTIYTAGALFSITAVGLNQFIIAQGYSGIGMCTTVIGALANVGLDPLFIYTFGMGVAGAALATILSQFLSFAFVFVFLLLKNTKIRLSFGGYSAKVIGKMFRLGLSPFLIIATDSIIIIISNMMLKTYGGAEADMWITVSTVVQAFLSVITMPLLGISTGTQPVLSYNYGARNIPLIKKAEKVIVLMGLAFTALMFGLSFPLAAPVSRLFTANEDIVSKAVWGIRIYMIGIIPLSLQYVFVDGMTALGQPKFAVTLSMTRKMAVYFGSIVFLPMFWGAEAVFYAEPIADIFGALLSSTVFGIFFPKILKKREAGPLEIAA